MILRLRLGSTEVSIVGTHADVWAVVDTWVDQLGDIEDEDLIYRQAGVSRPTCSGRCRTDAALGTVCVDTRRKDGGSIWQMLRTG